MERRRRKEKEKEGEEDGGEGGGGGEREREQKRGERERGKRGEVGVGEKRTRRRIKGTTLGERQQTQRHVKRRRPDFEALGFGDVGPLKQPLPFVIPSSKHRRRFRMKCDRHGYYRESAG